MNKGTSSVTFFADKESNARAGLARVLAITQWIQKKTYEPELESLLLQDNNSATTDWQSSPYQPS